MYISFFLLRYTKSDGTNTHTTTATSYGSTEHHGGQYVINGMKERITLF